MFERIKKALSFKKSYDPLTDQLVEMSKQLAANNAIISNSQRQVMSTTSSSINPSFVVGHSSHTIGSVYQPPSQTKKKLPIFKNEANRIYTEIQKDKNSLYNVTISFNNHYQQQKGWYSIIVGYDKIVTELDVPMYQTQMYGSINTVSFSGTFVLGPQGVQTKYPHQSIKIIIKYLKELDFNDHLIKRITIKKMLQTVKSSSKEMELYPNSSQGVAC